MYSEDLKNRSDLSLEEIEVLLKDEKNVKVFKKLLYFKFILSGFSKKEACRYAGIKESSRYYLDDLWEKGGYNALVPHYGGGRDSKLSEKQMGELRELLSQKDSWIVDEVQKLIKDKFNVDYTYHGVRALLIKLNVPLLSKFELKTKENTNTDNIINHFENLDDNEKEEVEEIIDKMNDEESIFVIKKLFYLLLRKIGFNNKISSNFLKITMPTGNSWLNQWIDGGYDSLLRKPGQGRKPKLSDEDSEDFKKN